MAIYPCSRGQHRYSGPQRSAYVTSMHGALSTTHKLRFCESHFAEMHEYASDKFNEVTALSTASDRCERCGDQVDSILSVRLYDLNKAEEQFVLDLCGPCTAAFTNEMQISDGKPL